MIELGEAINLAKQMNKILVGKRVVNVYPPTKIHKFCWFSINPEDYCYNLKNAVITGAEGFGIYAELSFDNGKKLCINDGVIPRLSESSEKPEDYQLLIEFDDDTILYYTVAMYGGICLHSGEYDNEYYLKSLKGVSPFSDEFEKYFNNMIEREKPTVSAKALLAAGQRIPGLGNGVLQDILFEAGINPKTKIKDLSDEKRQLLCGKIIEVLKEMRDKGGRDTEKDLLGNPGGYETKMSRLGIKRGCPVCGREIIKENYLGGTVYYCPYCQPVN